MTENMPQRREYLHYLHALMFSLNNGFAMALALRFFMFRSSHMDAPYYVILVRIYERINYSLRLDRMDSTAGNVILLALTIGFFLLVLLVLRLVTRTPANRVILNPVAAITSLEAVLASWMYDSSGYLGWYVFGLEGAVICGLLYLGRGWRIPMWCSGAFMVLHYSFWGRVLWQNVWYRSFRPVAVQPFAEAVPVLLSLVSPCSALVWTLYRSRPRVEPV